MRVGFKAINEVDHDGNPAGGEVIGTGFSIAWQQGPLGAVGSEDRKEPNGAFVEDVIDAARQRIAFYQEANGAKFSCEENARALGYLEMALKVLDERTQRRTEQGTEGTHVEDVKEEPVLPRLSKYRSHKEVRAARIETVASESLSGAALSQAEPPFLVLLSDPAFTGPPDDTPMVRVDVTSEWMEKHSPQVGGYFVVYEDGYTSYSPAKAFVEGYALIPE